MAKNLQNISLLKPVSFLEARKFSPWPNRILGKDTWKKTKREEKQIIEEYDKGWYKDALDFYKKEIKTLQNKKHPFTAYLVLKNFEKKMIEKVEKLGKVYGGFSSANYLVSIDEQLFLTDSYVFQVLFREFVAHTVDSYRRQTQSEAVIEAGSGTGINLFNLSAHTKLKYIRGGEICPNALTLSNSLVKSAGISGDFVKFSFYNPGSIENLCDYRGKYMLLTSHAIEQLPNLPENFIETIVGLKNPPEVVLHFEPVQFPGARTLFGKRCKRYSQMNLYNQDLFEKLKTAEKQKKIEILDVRKYVLGLSAFNPTSFIAWRPR